MEDRVTVKNIKTQRDVLGATSNNGRKNQHTPGQLPAIEYAAGMWVKSQAQVDQPQQPVSKDRI
jgi:hypothetical protein